MTKLKLLSAALIATAMLATPAMARTSHPPRRMKSRNCDDHAELLQNINAFLVGASPRAKYS